MRTGLALLALGIVQATDVGAASVSLFANQDCSSCTLQIPANQPSGTLYIYVSGVSDQPTSYGMIGAEFRADGLPAGWVATSVPSPIASISIGNPFGNGVNIAFSNTQHGECILLHTVTIVPVQPAAQATLRVRAHLTPTRPIDYNCPLLVYDDFEPIRVCVPGGSLFVNSDIPCTVGVASTTWAKVKRLFE